MLGSGAELAHYKHEKPPEQLGLLHQAECGLLAAAGPADAEGASGGKLGTDVKEGLKTSLNVRFFPLLFPLLMYAVRSSAWQSNSGMIFAFPLELLSVSSSLLAAHHLLLLRDAYKARTCKPR